MSSLRAAILIFALALAWAILGQAIAPSQVAGGLLVVATVIALGVPTIFSGAIITEQVFRVNGLGQLLITAIQGADIPLVQTLTFIFAILIVLFNLIADVLYGILDPRIRYE